MNPCALKTGFEFLAAATDESFGGFDCNWARRFNQSSRLIAKAIIDQDTARANQSPGQFDVFHQPARYDQKIKPLFFSPRRQQQFLQFSQPFLGLSGFGAAAMVIDQLFVNDFCRLVIGQLFERHTLFKESPGG